MCQALYQVVLYMLAQLICITTMWKKSTIITPIFQVSPLRLREGKWLATEKRGLEPRSLSVLPTGGPGHVVPREGGSAVGQGDITGHFCGNKPEFTGRKQPLSSWGSMCEDSCWGWRGREEGALDGNKQPDSWTGLSPSVNEQTGISQTVCFHELSSCQSCPQLINDS